MNVDENDFLNYYLYNASKSALVKKSRLIMRLGVSWIFILLAIYCYLSNHFYVSIYFFLASALWIIFFPLFSQHYYKMYFSKSIRETFKNVIDQKSNLEFTDDSIISKDISGEVKIRKAEIVKINEIKNYFFIIASNGTAFIIRKFNNEDISEINKEIKLLVEIFGVEHNVELDWKWA